MSGAATVRAREPLGKCDCGPCVVDASFTTGSYTGTAAAHDNKISTSTSLCTDARRTKRTAGCTHKLGQTGGEDCCGRGRGYRLDHERHSERRRVMQWLGVCEGGGIAAHGRTCREGGAGTVLGRAGGSQEAHLWCGGGREA